MEIMLIWVLLLVVIWTTVKTAYRLVNYKNLIHLAFFLAGLSLLVNVVAELVQQNFPQNSQWPVQPALVGEWAQISSVAFILCGLTLLIRLSKPVFARFPITFTALPLLIIATYPLAIETVMIKKWLLGIYEGGALVAAILIFSMKLVRNRNFILLLVGSVVLAGTYVLYWFPVLPSEVQYYWYLAFAIGLYLAVRGVDSAYPIPSNEKKDVDNIDLNSNLNAPATGLEQ